MAKKDKTDIFGSDYDWDNFDDEILGTGGSFKSSSSRSSKRDVVKTFAGSFVGGIKDALLRTEVQRDFVSNAFPKDYTTAYDAATSAASSIDGVYRTTARETASINNELKKGAKGVIPSIEKYLPEKLKKKSKRWADSYDKPYQATSDAQRENEFLSSELFSVFGALESSRAEKEAVKQSYDAVEKKVQTKLAFSSTEHLKEIRLLSRRSLDYQEQVDSKYKRKHLEIAYKQLFTQAKILDTSQQMLSMSKSAYEALVKNSSLPDVAKIQMNEEYMKEFRRKFIKESQEQVHDSFSALTYRLGNHFKKRITDKATDLRDSLEMLSGNAEMAGGLGDSLNDLTPEERKKMAVGGAGQIAGGIATPFLTKMLAKVLKKKYKDNDKVNNIGMMMSNFVNRAPRMFNDITSGEGSGNFTIDRIVDFLGLDQVRQGRNRVVQTSALGELEKSTYYSVHSEQALTRVIPGWLSRIHNEIRVFRTGDTSMKPDVYDFTKDEFSSNSAVVEGMSNRLLGERKGRVNDSLRTAIGSIDPNNELSAEARRSLSEYLTKKSMSGGDVNLFKMATSDTVKVSKDSKVNEEVSGFLKNKYNIGDDEYNPFMSMKDHIKKGIKLNPELLKIQSELNPILNSLNSEIGNPTAIMQQYARQNQLDQLRQTGLMKSDASGNHRMDVEEYIRRIVDDSINGEYSGDGLFYGPHQPNSGGGSGGMRGKWERAKSHGDNFRNRYGQKGRERYDQTKAKAGEKYNQAKAKAGEKYNQAKAKAGEKYDQAKGKANEHYQQAKGKYTYVKDQTAFGWYAGVAGEEANLAGKRGMKSAKSLFGKMSRGVKDQFSTFASDASSWSTEKLSAWSNVKMTNSLTKIQDTVVDLFKRSKKDWTDRDGDGDRDGSVKDQLQNRASKFVDEAKRRFKGDDSDKVQSKTGGLFDRIFGMLPGGELLGKLGIGSLIAASIPMIMSYAAAKAIPAALGTDSAVGQFAANNPLMTAGGVYFGAKAGNALINKGLSKVPAKGKLGLLGKLAAFIPKGPIGKAIMLLMGAVGIGGMSANANAGDIPEGYDGSGNGMPEGMEEFSSSNPSEEEGGGWLGNAAMIGSMFLPGLLGKAYRKMKGGKAAAKVAANAGTFSKLGSLAGKGAGVFTKAGRAAGTAAGVAGKEAMKTARTTGTIGSKLLSVMKGVGKFGGKGAVRALPWVGRAAMAGAAFISSPIVLGALAGAAVAGGGYLLYRMLKRDKSALQKLRYAQYGFKVSDEEYVTRIMELEKLLTPNVTYDGSGIASLRNGVSLEKVLSLFGVNVDNENIDDFAKWALWYQKRFKPVFLSHMTAMKRHGTSVNLHNPDAVMNKAKQIAYLNDVAFSGQVTPFQVMGHPFAGKSQLTESSRDVAVAYKNAHKNVAKLKDSAKDMVEERKEIMNRREERKEKGRQNNIRINEDPSRLDRIQRTLTEAKDKLKFNDNAGVRGVYKAAETYVKVVTAPGRMITNLIRGKGGSKVNLTSSDIIDIAKVVQTEVGHHLKGAAWNQQAAAVVDTILNRVASSGFPDTVRGVVNQRRQFSKITGPASLNPYGSVQKMPLSAVSDRTLNFVKNYLKARADGSPSIVGDNLNYANPLHSDAYNLKAWVNKLVGEAKQNNLVFGAGGSKHYHGTTSDKVKYLPGRFDVSIGGGIASVGKKSKSEPPEALKKAMAADNFKISDISKPFNMTGLTPAPDMVKREGTGRKRGNPSSQSKSAVTGFEKVSGGGVLKRNYSPELIALGKRATRLGSSGVDMQGLKPFFRDAFYAMVGEYNQKTGGKVQVNSAHRSFAKQKALYEAYQRGGTTAAKPGHSRHNHGVAIDINTVDANALIKHGLLNKYGFHRPLLHLKETWHLEMINVTPGKSLEAADIERNDNQANQVLAAVKRTNNMKPLPAYTSGPPRVRAPSDKTMAPVTGSMLDPNGSMPMAGEPAKVGVRESGSGKVTSTTMVPGKSQSDRSSPEAIVRENELRRAQEVKAAQVRKQITSENQLQEVTQNRKLMEDQLALTRSMDNSLKSIDQMLKEISKRQPKEMQAAQSTPAPSTETTKAAKQTTRTSRTKEPIDMGFS